MDITNLTFLFYGYSAAWIIITAFVFLLVSRGRRIDRELARLKSLTAPPTLTGTGMRRVWKYGLPECPSSHTV